MTRITSAALIGGTYGTTIENSRPHWIPATAQVTFDDRSQRLFDLEEKCGRDEFAALWRSAGLGSDVRSTNQLVGREVK